MSGGGGKGKKPKSIPIQPARVSTGFGSAIADPRTGNYSYTLDPRLAEMRDIFYGAAGEFMPTEAEQQFAQDVAQQGMGLFGTGQEYLNQALAMSPQDVGQQYYRDIQDLMSMDRAEEESRLANTLFKTGRTGVGAGVTGGYVNPEQFALLKAREQANTRLGIEAEQLGRQRQLGDVQFAQGLQQSGIGQYGQGYQIGATPYNTMAGIFGLGTNIEQLGFQPLGVGMQALNAQLAAQKAAQDAENAKAKSGKGGGLLGGVVNAGLNYATGGGFSGLSSLGSIFTGSSPSSGVLGSLGLGNLAGWGNANAGTPLGSWTPIDTTISPWTPAGSGYRGTVYPVY